MNPFTEKNKDFEFSMTDYVREIFKDKKVGETFEVDMHGYDAVYTRATIYQTGFRGYKTKLVNGKLYVLILNGFRTNVL